MANDLHEALSGQPPSEPYSRTWVEAFMKRHPTLRTRWGRAFERSRKIASNNPEAISQWFDTYKDTTELYDIKPTNEYNMDESGVLAGLITHRNKLLCYEDTKDAFVTTLGNLELVTGVECISGEGKAIPPCYLKVT